ncbi:chitin-binding type-2 domain-containing protein [Trichonephila inaurata madagascariensis]|uniref:Chitin-binding type-2 domain-containing protein n=1 Tax=Trichonephila inaurata madagascariensis TaxID=2747483 RepID=A0A8X6Y562_9ARAC|nr:chitin-binding type-2 domain-containing protein [Trichonephila inaurata madagascariensis]
MIEFFQAISQDGTESIELKLATFILGANCCGIGFRKFYYISRSFNSCDSMGYLPLCSLFMMFGFIVGINCTNNYTDYKGFYVAGADCKGYFYFTPSGPSYHICPEGQLFDSRILSCVISSTVNCNENKPMKKHRRSTLNEPRRNILMNQLILPILRDMAKDVETSKNLRYIFRTAKSVYQLVMQEKFANYQNSDGTSMHASAATVNFAKERFLSRTKPTIERVMEKHLPLILRRFSEKFTTMSQSMEEINKNFNTHAGELTDSVIAFVMKHRQLLDSDSSYINSKTLPSLRRDFRPIKSVLLRIFDDYLRTRPVSWMNFINTKLDFLSL